MKKIARVSSSKKLKPSSTRKLKPKPKPKPKPRPKPRPKPETSSGVTLPILFTDRTAFAAFVGAYTTLTLDAPDHVNENVAMSRYEATYGDLITFTFDLQGGVGVNSDGTVTLGRSTLAAKGTVLQPATAFGFDVVSGDARGVAHLAVNGVDLTIALANVHFIGLVSTTPVAMTVHYFAQFSDPQGGGAIGGFTIDNVAIKN